MGLAYKQPTPMELEGLAMIENLAWDAWNEGSVASVFRCVCKSCRTADPDNCVCIPPENDDCAACHACRVFLAGVTWLQLTLEHGHFEKKEVTPEALI
jgi:hypothetical protein